VLGVSRTPAISAKQHAPARTQGARHYGNRSFHPGLYNLIRKQAFFDCQRCLQ